MVLVKTVRSDRERAGSLHCPMGAVMDCASFTLALQLRHICRSRNDNEPSLLAFISTTCPASCTTILS